MSEAQHEKLTLEIDRLNTELELVTGCQTTGEVCNIIVETTEKTPDAFVIDPTSDPNPLLLPAGGGGGCCTVS